MKTLRIRLFGIVQGVGFRPFCAVNARRIGVRGTVANKGSYVEVFAQGSDEQLRAYLDTFESSAPERSVILDIEAEEWEYSGLYEGFEIIESEKEPGDIFVSPDIATCDKCRQELFDKSNRRYLHPFINCTQCGPRLTILDTMPYDRVRTSMGKFPMCEDCEREYNDPATRRYDAQPVCCNDCGPEVFILGGDKRGARAITAVRSAIMQGKIAAIKGIGGFHLCCDAKNPQAVSRLRQRKSRPMKPLAVMMRDMDTVTRECRVKEGQEGWLTGWQKPIMLLEKREDTSLCEGIAPDNPTVGVMLPYAPVQMLLFDYPDGVAMTDCLVMTSANVKGAPICRDDKDAQEEITNFCDVIMTHNRDILIRADDSVCDWLGGKPYMIRRSRGFAPLPVMLKGEAQGEVLAIGGELKNCFCVGKNGLMYVSPYVGDMADIRTVKALRESVGRMCGLLEAQPKAVVCDKHPMYNTVAVAQEMAQELEVPLIQIQHHYAHVLSCMAENGFEGKVIGVSFDGTGYGDDGTIWGGELMVCDYSGYERAGSIMPFMQVGGDASAKEGWRIAASVLADALGDEGRELCVKLGICDEKAFGLIKVMAEKKINSVMSTSCGRVFDAASAILGIRKASTFEGEASAALMFRALEYERSGREMFTLGGDLTRQQGRVILDTTGLLGKLAQKAALGGEVCELAYGFHYALAQMLADACEEISRKSGVTVCALSGGVFQNRLLVRLTKGLLEERGLRVITHHLIPPNDGGISLGQAAYAIKNKSRRT